MNGALKILMFVMWIRLCKCVNVNLTMKNLAIRGFHGQSSLIAQPLRACMKIHMSRFSKFLAPFVTGNFDTMSMSFCAFEKFKGPVLSSTTNRLTSGIYGDPLYDTGSVLYMSDCTFVGIVSEDAVEMESAVFVEAVRCFFERNELSGHGVKAGNMCDSNMSQITCSENAWCGIIGTRSRKLGSWRIDCLNITHEPVCFHAIEFCDTCIRDFVVSDVDCGLFLFTFGEYTELSRGKIYDVSSTDPFFSDIVCGSMICDRVMFGYHDVPENDIICHFLLEQGTVTISNCCFWFPEPQWVVGDAIITDAEQHNDCCDLSPYVIPYGIIKKEEAELAFGRKILEHLNFE